MVNRAVYHVFTQQWAFITVNVCNFIISTFKFNFRTNLSLAFLVASQLLCGWDANHVSIVVVET
jgi:hypothetical protein